MLLLSLPLNLLHAGHKIVHLPGLKPSHPFLWDICSSCHYHLHLIWRHSGQRAWRTSLWLKASECPPRLGSQPNPSFLSLRHEDAVAVSLIGVCVCATHCRILGSVSSLYPLDSKEALCFPTKIDTGNC